MTYVLIFFLTSTSFATGIECWDIENKKAYMKIMKEFRTKFKANKLSEIYPEVLSLKSRHELELQSCRSDKSFTSDDEKEYRDVTESINAMMALKSLDNVEENPAMKEKAIQLVRENKKGIDHLLEPGISEKFLNQMSTSKSKTEGKNTVPYDDWFTLQSTGIKSGKKYSFVACVNGQRNATAVQCHVPGSAAKRVFYNTDDIKDLDTKKKWANTINEVKCVTAYVTGGEAFIVDIKDQNECK